jgi:lysophospholipase L1-like esterase
MMQSVRLLQRAALIALWGICAFGWITSARSETTLPCDHFIQDRPMQPEPRENPGALKRADEITREAQSHQYSVVFLGDSLTHWWDQKAWSRYFGQLNPLNAGVSGDRTEHLLWRVENGNLYQQQPKAVVLLIGTNDLSHNRTPPETAERIRSILETLRKRLPGARILLEGLWPRNDQARLIREPQKVNELIAQCQGGDISFQNLWAELLDREHQLTHATAPDGLHLSESGYERVSPPIAEKLKVFLSVP